MKIGLIDVDSHNFPNLALMKISAWYKSTGHSVEWYSPMFSGHMDKVFMSKVFSFTPDYEYYIDADEVIKGGSGYCIEIKNGKETYNTANDNHLPSEIEHICPDYSLYRIHDTAYGYLTRGCPRNCGFCHTTQKDGAVSKKVANLSEFWNGQKNLVLLDQNLIACKEHIDLLEQVADSGARVDFNGGLDIRLITEKNIEIIKRIKFNNLHFAWDRYQDGKVIKKNLKMFTELTGFDRHKGQVMCYILTNYDTTIEQDIERIQFCRELNISPFPMIYDKKHADPIYKKMQRWCNNWIFWKTPTFEEYDGRVRKCDR